MMVCSDQKGGAATHSTTLFFIMVRK